TVDFPSNGGRVTQAFDLLKEVVNDLEGEAPPPLSSLKNELRRRKQGFSERDYGYGGFLQFVKAAQAKDLVDMQWSEEAEDYLVTSKEAKRTSTRRSSSATDDAADTEASPAKSTARKSTRKSTARKSTRKSTVRKSTAASGSRKSSAAKRGSSKSTSRRRTSDD
ncbi:MAG TPA: hypothetical protein VFS18_03900, partial [Actinomycetota bacterium]|nr:hypothetical protein [Actinomycetota bacterium]